MRDEQPRDVIPLHVREGGGGLQAPHSLEAEREVLSAVFVETTVATLDMIAAELQDGDWFFERHKYIYQGMMGLREKKIPVDPVTLQQALIDRGTYQLAGGARAIGELLDRAGTIANVKHYIAIVKQKAVLRRFYEVAQKIEVAALGDVADIETFVKEAETTWAGAIRERERLNTGPDWGDATVINVDELDKPPSNVWSVPTGLDPFDNYLPLRGLEPGWLVVAMCGPGAGKTSFALGNVTRATCEKGGGVVYFSAEMGQSRLNQRMIAGVSGVSSRAVKRRGTPEGPTQDQYTAWMNGGIQIAEWPLEVYRTGPVDSMVSRLRAIRDRGVGRHRVPLRLAIVDYIQRVKNGHKNGFDDIAHTMHQLQDAASETDLNIPILALSQPSTDARRTKKKTTGADAKGSGAIEEDCDLFIVINRGMVDRDAVGFEIVKGRDVDPYEWHAEDVMEKGTVKWHACGWRWDKKHMRFVAGTP